MARLNDEYLKYLSRYPLLTKSITAGILAALNESIASLVTKDIKTQKITVRNRTIQLKHVFSPKILTMILYGSLIVTPISHVMYGFINKIFKGPNLSKTKKIGQILTSLSTVTPALGAIYVSWLSIINNYETWSQDIKKIPLVVKQGLKQSYFTILKTSVMTSLVSLTIAQNFIDPELWVVFFNFVYFIIGTFQNIKVKKAQQLKQEKKD